MFHTIGTRTAADARNALIFFLYQAAPVPDALPVSLCSKCRSKRCFYCPDFSPLICPRLLKPPYVCNSCPKLRTCSHDFYFYRAKYAEDSYQEVKSSSRSGSISLRNPWKTGQAHLSSFEARAASVPYLSHPQGGDQLFPADSLQLYRSPLFLCSKSGSPQKSFL